MNDDNSDNNDNRAGPAASRREEAMANMQKQLSAVDWVKPRVYSDEAELRVKKHLWTKVVAAIWASERDSGGQYKALLERLYPDCFQKQSDASGDMTTILLHGTANDIKAFQLIAEMVEAVPEKTQDWYTLEGKSAAETVERMANHPEYGVLPRWMTERVLLILRRNLCSDKGLKKDLDDIRRRQQ